MPRKSKKKMHAGTAVLSPENLSNTGTSTMDAATIADDPVNSSNVLVSALTNFILHITQAHTDTLPSGKNQSVRYVHDSRLSPEAKGVLIALEKFIESFVGPQKTQQGVTDNSIDAPQDKLILASKHTATAISAPKVHDAYEQQLLNAALKQAHYRVFNRMPIRLLAFRPDGSGMDLIERSAILDRISTSVRYNIGDLRASVNRVRQDKRAEKKAIEDFISHHTKYAILSHTWLHGSPGEVTYASWKAGEFDEASPGYQKLVNFCKVAAVDHGVTLGWMDTICINKESSSELDESIRSMFKWYCDASICVTYLAQTTALGHMHIDPWFTRGWTLQELLAPRYTKFYGKNWQQITDDPDHDAKNIFIQREIQIATTITQDELNLFQESRHRLHISRRMQWAANRRVTREEDTAYSLMGIFDVSISIAYGEGSERAFFRLVNEILASGKTDVLDIVNWCIGSDPELEIFATNAHPSSLIPSSPKQYLWRAKEDITWFPLITPITLTHVGLRLPVLLMPGIAANPDSPGAEFYPIGLYSATVNIDAEDPIDPAKRLPRTYNLLDMKIQTIRNDWKTPTSAIMLFGVLNFGETDTSIALPSPSPCIAVCLHSHSNSPVQLVETSNIRKIETSSVIVFDLNGSRYTRNSNSEIEKDSLGRHGMILHTLHL